MSQRFLCPAGLQMLRCPQRSQNGSLSRSLPQTPLSRAMSTATLIATVHLYVHPHNTLTALISQAATDTCAQSFRKVCFWPIRRSWLCMRIVTSRKSLYLQVGARIPPHRLMTTIMGLSDPAQFDLTLHSENRSLGRSVLQTGEFMTSSYRAQMPTPTAIMS